MSSTRSDSSSPASHLSSRRGFLRTTGGAVALTFASRAVSASRASAAEQAAASPQRPLVDPKSGVDGIQQLLKSPEPLTWVLTGDSITHGALHTKGWRSYPEHFAERVRWEMRRVRDVVINTGISGDRTGGLLKDMQWRALRFQPDVVSVMLGMNDCTAGAAGRDTFRTNLLAIVEKTLGAGAIPLLHAPNTIYVKNAGGRADLEAYAEIVRQVADSQKVALVDHWQHWQKTKPDQEALLPWLEDRSIHPGVYGHREMAKLTFRVLGIYDEQSPTCQLEVP